MGDIQDQMDDALIEAFADQGWIMRADGGITTRSCVTEAALDLPKFRDYIIEFLGLRQEWSESSPIARSAGGQLVGTFPRPQREWAQQSIDYKNSDKSPERHKHFFLVSRIITGWSREA
ncbi:hypothetical protein ONA92_21680 [Mycobacteroides salmoniphilum]|uniref:hypothetical protein n=1 Tax=Mycobacteroides salmoniphilum TaxID=404941 RepID=UPI0035617F73